MRSLVSHPLPGATNSGPPSLLGFLLVTLVLLCRSGADGQDRQVFEVSSVRVNPSGDAASSLRPHPDGALTITNHSLVELIAFAFDVRADQVVGAPAWAGTRRFDILANGGPNAPAIDGRRESSSVILKLRSLLEDRFSLRVHFEVREQPVLELLVRTPGRLGPQLSTSVGCDASPSVTGSDADASRSGCGLLFGSTGLRGDGAPMAEIARVLGFLAHRPVIDRTALAGFFDVQLRFRPEEFERLFAPGSETPDLDVPSLFTAVEEQLGLRLRPTRGPVRTVVVDAVQMPDPN